jgi:hypothetical protein
MRWQDRAAITWRRERPTPSQVALSIALGLLLLQLGIALFEYARLAWTALDFPFPLDYGEGPILDQVLRLAHFENIYRNSFAAPPYTVSNYPPLFHLVQVPFAWLFGPAYWYGRLISMASAIAAALFIGLILHVLTGDKIASGIGAAILLSVPYILQWSVFDRVDTLALALSLGGLYVVVRGSANQPAGRRTLRLGAMLLTAAIYTRQSYALAAPLAALVWLWQTHGRRQALTLAGLVAMGCLGLFVTLNLLTQGGFYLNIVLANLNPLSAVTVTGYLVDLYFHAAYLLIACLAFAIVARLAEPTRSWPLVIAYGCGAAVTTFTAGKTGSNVNYLYEAAAALCLGGGALIAWCHERHWLKAALALVLALQVNDFVQWSRGDYIPFVIQKVGDYREVTQLAELVRAAHGPVLADEYMGLLPLFGRKLSFQPFEYKELAEANLWSQATLIGSIDRQEFSAILLYEPRTWNAIQARWTPEIQDSIYAHYRLDSTLAETFVYLPAGTDVAK